MSNVVEKYINRLISLADYYLPIEPQNEFDEGRNCAVDCINQGANTRIDILRDHEKDTDVTFEYIESLYRELINTMVDSLSGCMAKENTDFYRGYMEIVSDFIERVK